MVRVWNVISTYPLHVLTGAVLALVWAITHHESYPALVQLVFLDHPPVRVYHLAGGEVVREPTVHFLTSDIGMVFSLAIAAPLPPVRAVLSRAICSNP